MLRQLPRAQGEGRINRVQRGKATASPPSPAVADLSWDLSHLGPTHVGPLGGTLISRLMEDLSHALGPAASKAMAAERNVGGRSSSPGRGAVAADWKSGLATVPPMGRMVATGSSPGGSFFLTGVEVHTPRAVRTGSPSRGGSVSENVSPPRGAASSPRQTPMVHSSAPFSLPPILLSTSEALPQASADTSPAWSRAPLRASFLSSSLPMFPRTPLTPGPSQPFHLTSLCLSGCGLGLEGAAPLLQAAARLTTLRHLDLSRNGLDATCVPALVSLAACRSTGAWELGGGGGGGSAACPAPIAFNLSGNQLNDKAGAQLITQLLSPATCQPSSPSPTPLGEDVVKYGEPACRSPLSGPYPACAVTGLDLSFNAFGPATCQALCDALAADSLPLRSLRLASCGLQPVDVVALAPGLFLRDLDCLDLSGNRVGPEGARALREHAERVGSRRSGGLEDPGGSNPDSWWAAAGPAVLLLPQRLLLSGCSLECAGAAEVAAVLRAATGTTAAESPQAYQPTQAQAQRLSELGMQGNHICTPGATALGMALAVAAAAGCLPNLSTLDLSNNRLGLQGVQVGQGGVGWGGEGVRACRPRVGGWVGGCGWAACCIMLQRVLPPSSLARP